jgi:hypothetical protein
LNSQGFNLIFADVILGAGGEIRLPHFFNLLLEEIYMSKSISTENLENYKNRILSSAVRPTEAAQAYTLNFWQTIETWVKEINDRLRLHPEGVIVEWIGAERWAHISTSHSREIVKSIFEGGCWAVEWTGGDEGKPHLWLEISLPKTKEPVPSVGPFR